MSFHQVLVKYNGLATSFLIDNGIVSTISKIQWTTPMTLLNLTNPEAPMEVARVVDGQTRAAGWSLCSTFKDSRESWKALPVDDLVELIDES